MSEFREGILKIAWRRLKILKQFLLSGVKIVAFKPYWHDKYVTPILLFCSVINIGNWWYLWHFRVDKSYPVILHYNLFAGVDFMGPYDTVFILPLTGLCILVINSFASHFLYKGERLAAYLITINIFLVQFLLVVASYLIINANQ